MNNLSTFSTSRSPGIPGFHNFCKQTQTIMEGVHQVYQINSFTYSGGDENATVHLMPCKIDYDGVAKVEQYFVPSIIPIPSSDGAETEGNSNAVFFYNF